MSALKGTEAKRRVIVDYKNVSREILDLFTDRYPYGYDEGDIIKFQNAKGQTLRAVPFETKDTKYLVKVSVEMDAHIEAYMEDEQAENNTTDDSALEMEGLEPEEMDD